MQSLYCDAQLTGNFVIMKRPIILLVLSVVSLLVCSCSGPESNGKKMIYNTLQHETLKVGDRWQVKANPDAKIKSITIVAVDGAPKDSCCVNIVIDRPDATDKCKAALVPMDYNKLKPSLIKVIERNVDVSEHIESYQNWKAVANQGKAGFWTLDIENIVKTTLKMTQQTQQ